MYFIDIIVCKDGNDFVRPQGFEDYALADIKRPTDLRYQWFAIIPVNWNNVIRDTTTPVGLMNMKCRQLCAIGYEPILVISKLGSVLSVKLVNICIFRFIGVNTCSSAVQKK